ncbi:MAG: TonB family protein, partial [Candidatus Omnitrophica bacterium]|nr:TonB family protein [Candidatus Omnitrophota bacterium]
MLWDSKGQRASRVEVASRIPETLETELRQLLNQLNLSGVNVHREKNKLFLTGLVSRQEDLERIEQMLAAFKDQVTNLVALSSMPSTGPPPSVKLTVQLIEMSRDAKDQFGVDWSDSLTFTETTFGAAAITESLIERVEDVFRIGTVARSGDAGSLKAVLSFLVSKNKARILAEPRLVAASGKEATTFLGLEVPVITTSNVTALGTVSQSIEFKNTGVELQFTPTVLEPDRSSIRLVISAKVSSIDKSVGVKVLGGETVPGFRVRQTQTEIVTASGASVLISGLLQDEEKKNISQVPAVGSIPVLGNLFRSTEFVTGQTELIVLVTSELLGGTAEPIADRSEILEQALSSAELAASVEDPSLRYALQVQDRIAKSIRYPIREKELSMGGRVKLRLHLFRDGTLGKALVTESSGIESLDSEAMKAAESQSPYPA